MSKKVEWSVYAMCTLAALSIVYHLLGPKFQSAQWSSMLLKLGHGHRKEPLYLCPFSVLSSDVVPRPFFYIVDPQWSAVSMAGWRTVMAKWIGDARAAEAEETDDSSDSDDDNNTKFPAQLTPVARPRNSKWKKRTLAQLFGGSQKKHAEHLSQEEIEAEADLMEALAEAEAEAEALAVSEEDARPDYGAVEIGSDEEYRDVRDSSSSAYTEVCPGGPFDDESLRPPIALPLLVHLLIQFRVVLPRHRAMHMFYHFPMWEEILYALMLGIASGSRMGSTARRETGCWTSMVDSDKLMVDLA
ncbi:hypothetical protein B0H19DRAFT_1068353 [Mycena capillaripes]|nr:hypothetical protein B0H19DRAFT_1068353 [Mycena capillaripes]